MSIKQGGVLIAGGGQGGGQAVVNMDNITITNNANNEIQTVAKINQNQASGAEAYLFDWCGTLAEYNSQAIATTHPEWICYITDDNSGSGGDETEQIVTVIYNTTPYANIKAAYDEGKIILCVYNDAIYYASYFLSGTTSYIYFSAMRFNSTTIYGIRVSSSNVWTPSTTVVQSSINGAASTITTANLTTDRALISNLSGKVAVSTTTSSELEFLSGTTSNVQSQLDNKVSKGYEIIDFQLPTSANSYMWYKKYANGWVEQGGISATVGTITLPVEMDSIGYSLTVTPIGTGSNQDVHANKVSTTQIEIGNGADWNMDWEVKGLAAQQ